MVATAGGSAAPGVGRRRGGLRGPFVRGRVPRRPRGAHGAAGGGVRLVPGRGVAGRRGQPGAVRGHRPVRGRAHGTLRGPRRDQRRPRADRGRQRPEHRGHRELAARPALGGADRARHRVDGPGVRGHRGQPLVRAAARAGHGRPDRRQRDRAADLPAGAGLDERGVRVAVGLAGGCRGRPGRHPAGAAAPAQRAGRPGRRPVRRPAGTPVAPGDPMAAPGAGPGPARRAVATLAEAARTRTFWALAVGFAICGASTNGLIATHFIPSAHDHGMPETTAAGLLAVVGVFDIVGTVASGWLTDKVNPRLLLAAYYSLRGAGLLMLPGLLSDSLHPSMIAFVVVYGL